MLVARSIVIEFYSSSSSYSPFRLAGDAAAAAAAVDWRRSIILYKMMKLVFIVCVFFVL